METPKELITNDPLTGEGNLDFRAKVSAKRFALSLQVVAHEPSRRRRGGVEVGEELRIIIALAKLYQKTCAALGLQTSVFRRALRSALCP